MGRYPYTTNTKARNRGAWWRPRTMRLQERKAVQAQFHAWRAGDLRRAPRTIQEHAASWVREPQVMTITVTRTPRPRHLLTLRWTPTTRAVALLILMLIGIVASVGAITRWGPAFGGLIVFVAAVNILTVMAVSGIRDTPGRDR